MDGVELHRLPRAEGPFEGEHTFLRLLPTIDRISHAVSRRYRLSPPDAEEFASIVRLHLLDNDYQVLRRFQGRSSVRTFLTTVIGRQCLDWLTLPARRRQRVCSVQNLDRLQIDAPDPEEVLTRREARRMQVVLARALATLDPADRQIIAWHFWKQSSIAEIARRHGLNQRRLYRRLSRILERLRTELETRGLRPVDIPRTHH